MFQWWKFFIFVVILIGSVTSHPTITWKISTPYASTSPNLTHANDGTPTSDTNVPADDDVYGMEVGNTAEASISVSQAFPTRHNWTCYLSCMDQNIPSHIRYLIDAESIKLIEYSLLFPAYNSSPLISNATVYKAESWARTSTRHGQTLLSLSFNYGILSMMTLSVGTTALNVTLTDHPEGCIGTLTETEQFDRVIHLLLRDFQNQSEVTVTGGARLCHEAIVNKEGYAVFVDMCCYADPTTSLVVCEPDVVNFWLRLLQLILSLIRLGVLFFGPLLFVSTVVAISRRNFPYIVKLKEPLTKTALLVQDGAQQTDPLIKAEQHLNLRHAEGFAKLKASIAGDVPLGKPVPIRISQYDILVCYKRTLTENSVPVGFWRGLFGAVFRCGLRNVGPFRDCCRASMCRTPGCCGVRKETKWISFWSKVGLVVLVLLIPSPYYLRLFVFYQFEYDEVVARKEAAARLGLKEQFSSNPLHYFTPTHPIFLLIYIVYFITAGVIGFTMRRDREGVFLRIIAGAFDDLNSLQWTTVLHVMVNNIIWPFKHFGVVGCLVVLVYWPVAIPLSIILYAFYCLPTVYVTVRMLFHARNSFLLQTTKRVRVRPYRARKRPDNSIKRFEVERYIKRGRRHADGHLPDDDLDLGDLDALPPKSTMRQVSESTSVGSTMTIGVERTFGRCFALLLASTLCVAALFSSLIIVSECLGCVVEVALFTLMGVIVNAATLLKYVALVILLVVYSQDCFNDVQKNYLKLNKALFSEVKGRIKDIDKVTSMPSSLQENHGFKSQELSEQAFYEEPDDLDDRPPGFWLINDLVLFIDNEDMPRIPLKLFEEVCQIRVAGVPGPVYRGQLMALKRFSKIVMFVFFVFVVVLSFSEAYKVSSTNQMLATMAGGFLPLILRTVMGSGDDSELELGTLSFRSKLDEVIKNFRQYWPIYDLPFELDTSPEPEEEKLSPEEFPQKSPLVTTEANGIHADWKSSPRTDLESDPPRGVTFKVEDTDVVKVDFIIDLPPLNAGVLLTDLPET